MSRINANAVVVLPDPDSPTSPNRSPGLNVNVTPSTALTGPLGVPYCTRKSSTCRTPLTSTASVCAPRGERMDAAAADLLS